jgi:hypothetical protein
VSIPTWGLAVAEGSIVGSLWSLRIWREIVGLRLIGFWPSLKVVVIGGPRIREMLCPCGGVSSWIGCERPRPNLSFFQSDNQQDEVEQLAKNTINHQQWCFGIWSSWTRIPNTHIQFADSIEKLSQLYPSTSSYLVKYELSFFIYFYLFSMKLSQSHYLKHKYCELTRVDLGCFMIYKIIFLLVVQVIFRLAKSIRSHRLNFYIFRSFRNLNCII